MKLDQLWCGRGISCYDEELEREDYLTPCCYIYSKFWHRVVGSAMILYSWNAYALVDILRDNVCCMWTCLCMHMILYIGKSSEVLHMQWVTNDNYCGWWWLLKQVEDVDEDITCDQQNYEENLGLWSIGWQKDCVTLVRYQLIRYHQRCWWKPCR